MAINYEKGDLVKLALEDKFDAIVHGCNCMCQMGAGVALAIRNAFPKAFESDQLTKPGDKAKLGRLSTALCETGTGGELVVINAYTQYDYKGDGCLFDYDAFTSCCEEIKRRFSGKRIGMPKIGAGLAKGDWDKIEGILSRELAEEELTIVIFE